MVGKATQKNDLRCIHLTKNVWKIVHYTYMSCTQEINLLLRCVVISLMARPELGIIVGTWWWVGFGLLARIVQSPCEALTWKVSTVHFGGIKSSFMYAPDSTV